VFGKNGWSEFAEAWFTNDVNKVYCPFTIAKEVVASIKKDIEPLIAGYPKPTRDLIELKFIGIEVSNYGVPKWSVTCKQPPSWCPFKEYHSMKGYSKLPIRLKRFKEKPKKKYPPGTKLWHGIPIKGTYKR